MAYFNGQLRTQIKQNPPIKLGNGENTALTPFDIDKTESSYSRNTSSRNYPALSVRPGKSKQFGTDSSVIASPNGLGQRNNT